MKKVKFIYNPYSGENSIISDLDSIVKIHQKYNYSVVPYRISMEYDLSKAFDDIDESFSYILVAGGDGTLDNVVNHMRNLHINKPVGILPVGTANDFAKYLGIPQDVEEACIQILNSKPKGVDLGKINDKYFLNVASTGLFTDISQKTDVNLKNSLGKLAYYVKGIEQIPNFRKLRVKVTSQEVAYDGDMYLMLIFNGQTAGNLKLAYKAQIDDGLLDVIIIKAAAIRDMIPLFIKMIRGDHLEDTTSILYFKTNNLQVETEENIVTDIDGERGPDFPLTIECIKDGIQMLGIDINEAKHSLKKPGLTRARLK